MFDLCGELWELMGVFRCFLDVTEQRRNKGAGLAAARSVQAQAPAHGYSGSQANGLTLLFAVGRAAGRT